MNQILIDQYCPNHFREKLKGISKKIRNTLHTLESVIDVGQGISIGPGRFGKKNKRRALNKYRAWEIWKKE